MKRPLFIIGFTYLITLGVCIFLSKIAIFYSAICLFALALIILICQFFKNTKFWIFPIVFLTAGIAMSVYMWNENKNVAPAQSLNGQDVAITAELCDLPYLSNGRWRYILKIKEINGKKQNAKFKILLSVESPVEMDYYDLLKANVNFYQALDSPNFYSKTFYKSKGIYSHAFLYEYQEHEVESPQKKPFYYNFLKFKSKLLSVTKSIFPERNAHLINNIILGERHELPDDIQDDFLYIGAYHILVVSAFHISIVSSIVFFLFKKILKNKRLAALVSAISIFGFIALTGFTGPILRAGIVSIIYFLGMIFYRKPDSLTSLGIAILLICTLSPDSGADIGLWLSIFSHLGIILSFDKIKTFLREKLKIKWDFIKNSSAITISVNLFTLPITVLFFKFTSLLAVISNLLLLWAVELILPLALTTAFLYLIPFLNFLIKPLAFVCLHISNYILFISKMLAKIPYMFTSSDFRFVNLWMAMTLILIALSIILAKKDEKINFILPTLLSIDLLLVSVLSYQISIANLTRLSVLNCSEGLQIMISKNNHEIGFLFSTQKTHEEALEKYLLRVNTFNASKVILYNSEDMDKIVKMSFFENITLEKETIDDKMYINLEIGDVRFLILPNGGYAQKIPKNWKNPTFLIASGLPVNFEKINPRNIIVSMSAYETPKILEKIGEKLKCKTVSTANYGDILMDVNSDFGYKLRGSI